LDVDRSLLKALATPIAAAVWQCRAQRARWLGDIREYFPASVVQVLQHDAFDRLDMAQMLLEPECCNRSLNVRLVADLIALSGMIPANGTPRSRWCGAWSTSCYRSSPSPCVNPSWGAKPRRPEPPAASRADWAASTPT
jgi:hypothetical protein